MDEMKANISSINADISLMLQAVSKHAQSMNMLLHA
jgi:hypothetical protein